MKRIIHAWEIDGYINVKPEFKKFLEKKIIKRYGSISKLCSNLTLSTSIYRFFKLEEGFLPIWKFFNITDVLKVSRKKGEKNIILFKDSSNTPPYKIYFPLQVTLPMFRVIAHLPGDGCNGCKIAATSKRSLIISRYWVNMRWSQKNIKPMQDLLTYLFPNYKFLNKEKFLVKKEINLPALLIKIFAAVFGEQPVNLKTSTFVNAVLKLPKEYRVQALVAMIEDEGTIDIDSHQLRIFNTDKQLLESYIKLVDSLGYKRSQLYEEKRKQFKTKYYFNLHTSGLRKFAKDIKEICKKYGNLLGFWKKKESFEILIKRISTEKALAYEKYKREVKKMEKKIVRLLQKNKILKLSQIVRSLGLNPKNKLEEKKVGRIVRKIKGIVYVKLGYYALKGSIKKVPKYKNSREGILSLLKKKPMNAKEIIEKILKEGTVKDKSSIYVRLKKLREEGKIILAGKLYILSK